MSTFNRRKRSYSPETIIEPQIQIELKDDSTEEVVTFIEPKNVEKKSTKINSFSSLIK